MKSLKYIFFCFILLCIGYSCNDSSSHDHEPPKVMFTLAGEINNSEDTVVSIVSMIGNKIVFDTVYMDSCYFNYKGVADSISKINLYYGEGKYKSLFLRKKDSVYVRINALNDSLESVSGDVTNSLYYSHNTDSIINKGEEAIKKFIVDHRDNGASIVMLSLNMDKLRNQRTINNMLDSIDKELKTEYLTTEIKSYAKKKNKIEVNTKIPYLIVKDIDGKRINVFENKDYYTLVTFWSSYDSVSVARIKELKQLDAKFKNRPLRMINISLDDNDSIIKPLIKKYNIPGSIVRLEKGWSDEIIDKAGVYKLPYNFIADTVLSVSQIDLYGKELTNYLDKSVPKKIKPKKTTSGTKSTSTKNNKK